MTCPVGWGKTIELRPGLTSTLKDGREFTWSAVHLDDLRLAHPSHLMLIEGATPSWLFMGAKIVGITNPDILIKGPFMLLHMNAPALHTVPFVLTDVVFGIPAEIPAGAKLGDLVPSMFHTLYTSPEAW